MAAHSCRGAMPPLRSATCERVVSGLSSGTSWGAAVGAVVAEGAAGCRGTTSPTFRSATFAQGMKSFLLSSEKLPWTILFFLLMYIVVDKCGLMQVGEPATSDSDNVEALGLGIEEPSAGMAVGAVSRELSSSGGHPHDVLLFLFNAIVVGIVVTQAKHISWFRGMQQTVVTFVLGMIYSLIMQGLSSLGVAHKDLGMLWRSYDMWMHIDPHLLLFTMLPALLAGDAMNIDTSIVRRVASQCILLAGPGVLVNGISIALFLWVYLPYDWSFLLSLTTGAILCATDPVATVALLKELGASPTITTQIQGESLLNDGTAIVLYTLSYNMLKGESYDVPQVIIFLVRTAMCAWFLGMLIGYIFFFWISAANNKFDHHSSILQIALSLCCAYWSFIIAEGVLKMSGVLATVAASLVLADKMWHVLVSKESMHTVWEMVEYLGNTLIFFLAGALFGKTMAHVEGQDVGHLLVIYLFVTVIRLIILMLFRPLLRVFASKYKQDVTVTDVLVMTWGGLRGAVGLALAIQVNVERAGTLSERDAHRVLFYVGGVAALTLIVNATTCPYLVKNLGLTQLPETKQRMLFRIHDQLWRILDRRLRHKPSLRFLSDMFSGVLEEVRDTLLADEVSVNFRETASCWNEARSIYAEDLHPETEPQEPKESDMEALRRAADANAAAEVILRTAPPDNTGQAPTVQPYQIGVKAKDNAEDGAAVGESLSPNGKLHAEEPPPPIFRNGNNLMVQNGSSGPAVTKVKCWGAVQAAKGGQNETEPPPVLERKDSQEMDHAPSMVASQTMMLQQTYTKILGDQPADAGAITLRQLRREKIWSARMTKMNTERFTTGSEGEREGSTRITRLPSIVTTFTMRRSEAPSALLKRANGLTRNRSVFQRSNVVDDLTEERNAFMRIPERDVELLGDVGKMPSYDQEVKLIRQVMSSAEEPLLLRAINEAFLNLVKAQYWEQIQAGEIVSGTHEASILLSSIKLALSQENADLCDFGFIRPYVERPLKALSSLEPLQRHSTMSSDMGANVQVSARRHGRFKTSALASANDAVHSVVESANFQLLVMFAVIGNALFIAIEEAVLGSDETGKRDSAIGWLIADAMFTTFFLIEFLLMFYHLKMKYFCDAWHLFDFALVILGIFGLVLNALLEADPEKYSSQSENTDVANEGRLVRIARVFRVLRLLRIFRLVKFIQVVKAKFLQAHLSLETAEHIQKITMLLCFVKAHTCSQQALVQFFGIANEVDSVEIAHCILQSQVETYKALSMAVSEQQELDAKLLLEKEHYNCLKDTAENLENFVTSAHKGGVLTSNEAESVLRPLRKVVKKCNAYIKNTHFGYTRAAPAGEHERKVESTDLPPDFPVVENSTLDDSHAAGQADRRDEKSPASAFALGRSGAKTVHFETALVEDDLPTVKAEKHANLQNHSTLDDCEVDVIRVIDA